ncbi:MAG TPA: hypothetical protein ENF73_06345 [Proteobacteria bacterium]|nr:hypothetical protein [Pseudomonadota bacterium]
MSPRFLSVVSLLLALSVPVAASELCRTAFGMYESGAWDRARAALADAAPGEIADDEVCEFVLAATEPMAFVRIARLKLFVDRHRTSELVSRARSELVATMWLLGDTGGALGEIARGLNDAASCEETAILAASLVSSGFADQALVWFRRAREACGRQPFADLLKLYALKLDCERATDASRCAREAAKLLACGDVDGRAARRIVASSRGSQLDGYSDLRLYLLLNGYDERAMFGVEKLGLLGYIAGGFGDGLRCLIVDVRGEEFVPVRDVLWLWLKERGLEAVRADGGDRIAIGPVSYGQAERIRSELKRLFDLDSRLGSCPRKTDGEVD